MTLSLTGAVLDLLIRGLLIAAALLLALLALRIVLTRGAAALEPWHLFVPDEPAVGAIEQGDWADYLAAEDRLMAAVEDEVSGRLAPADQVPINRYFKGSPVHPEGLRRNWNRSFVLEPDGPARGAAVLLHGLTDSPSGRASAGSRRRPARR